MSIKSRIAAIALVALAAGGTMASSTQQAQAGNNLGLGIAAGVIGAAVVGSAVAANQTGYYGYGYGFRHCGWVSRYNAYGAYVGRVRTCND